MHIKSVPKMRLLLGKSRGQLLMPMLLSLDTRSNFSHPGYQYLSFTFHSLPSQLEMWDNWQWILWSQHSLQAVTVLDIFMTLVSCPLWAMMPSQNQENFLEIWMWPLKVLFLIPHPSKSISLTVSSAKILRSNWQSVKFWMIMWSCDHVIMCSSHDPTFWEVDVYLVSMWKYFEQFAWL